MTVHSAKDGNPSIVLITDVSYIWFKLYEFTHCFKHCSIIIIKQLQTSFILVVFNKKWTETGHLLKLNRVDLDFYFLKVLSIDNIP